MGTCIALTGHSALKPAVAPHALQEVQALWLYSWKPCTNGLHSALMPLRLPTTLPGEPKLAKSSLSFWAIQMPSPPGSHQ